MHAELGHGTKTDTVAMLDQTLECGNPLLDDGYTPRFKAGLFPFFFGNALMRTAKRPIHPRREADCDQQDINSIKIPHTTAFPLKDITKG